MNKRKEYKLKDLSGMKKAMSELLGQAWERGYMYGYTRGVEDTPISKGEWIPVSERLPDKNMACLVSVGDFYLTQIAMYSDLMGTISHKIFYQGDYGHKNFSDITEYVIAWMPLPKPYKETDNETDN